MFKRIGSFLSALTFSVAACNALQWELLDGDFSYLIDAHDKTAIIRWIYISAHTRKEIVIPKYVTDYHGDKYLVTEIQENAIKQAIPRIKSFIARDEFMKNEKNFAALRWLIIRHVPFVSIGKDYDSDSDFSEE